MPTHTEKRIMPYTAKQMYDLVADVESYPEFLPWCAASRIKNVIKEAIIKGVSTMNDFFDVNGENGYFQNDHKVYDREDEPCFKCQFPIKQLKLGQRSSFFCKKCQK